MIRLCLKRVAVLLYFHQRSHAGASMTSAEPEPDDNGRTVELYLLPEAIREQSLDLVKENLTVERCQVNHLYLPHSSPHEFLSVAAVAPVYAHS